MSGDAPEPEQAGRAPEQSCLLTFSTALEHLKANRTEYLVPTGKVPDQRFFTILPAIGTARCANPNFTVPVIQLPSASLPGRFANESARPRCVQAAGGAPAFRTRHAAHAPRRSPPPARAPQAAGSLSSARSSTPCTRPARTRSG